jgi:hypothetical protein
MGPKLDFRNTQQAPVNVNVERTAATEIRNNGGDP